MSDAPRTGSAGAAAVVLAMVTGYVDALCFGYLFGVFPANQTGNLVLFGIGLGDASVAHAWRPALSMLGFAAGVAAAALLVIESRSAPRLRWLLAAEIALLAIVAVGVGDQRNVIEPMTGAKGGSLLVLVSIAMGVQTEVIRRVAQFEISTTYETGALTQIAERGAQSLGRWTRPPRTMIVVALVFAGYGAGAAIGAVASKHLGAALLGPIFALAILLITLPHWATEGMRR